MHTLLKFLLALVFLLPGIIMLTLWSWLADQSTATVFKLPQGVISHGEATYYLVIGKEQVHPEGTVWKTTFGDGWMSAEPQIEGPTLQKIMDVQSIELELK